MLCLQFYFLPHIVRLDDVWGYDIQWNAENCLLIAKSIFSWMHKNKTELLDLFFFCLNVLSASVYSVWLLFFLPRNPPRTAQSPETLTGRSRLMTISKTLEEMGKIHCTKSARWDSQHARRWFIFYVKSTLQTMQSLNSDFTQCTKLQLQLYAKWSVNCFESHLQKQIGSPLSSALFHTDCYNT